MTPLCIHHDDRATLPQRGPDAKSRIVSVALAAVLGALIIACSGTSRAAQVQPTENAAPSRPAAQAARPDDPEIAALVQLADQATRQAQSVAPGAALQQLSIIWGTGRVVVRFTNPRATEEITVEVPAAGVPAARWPTGSMMVSPLATGRPRPALPLAALRVPPSAAAQALQQHWPGVRVTGVMLVLEEGGELAWYVGGEVADGAVHGKVRDATSTFELVGPGRPVQRPRTQRHE
jgi:hypothetical protein